MKENFSRKIRMCFFALFFAVIFGSLSVSVFASGGKVVPRIDNEAAMVEKNEAGVIVMESEKNIYSQNFWMLLFGAYLFLLLFNLSFGPKKKGEIQWFWEAALTFFAIFIWDQLDFARANTWFPGAVLESGIIIYAFYFYLLGNKKD